MSGLGLVASALKSSWEQKKKVSGEKYLAAHRGKLISNSLARTIGKIYIYNITQLNNIKLEVEKRYQILRLLQFNILQ